METNDNSPAQHGKISERDTLLAIAKEFLHIETLEVRNSDSLDFHDLSVSAIREALEAAYRAGMDANS